MNPRSPVPKAGVRGDFVALLACATSLTALAIDALLPARSEIARAFDTGLSGQTQLTISIFILGMALGELVAGPLSDALGRRPVVLGGIAVFCLGTLGGLLALSFSGLIAGRLVQGLGASGVKIATRALLRDSYRGADMARVMSMIFALFMIVPLLAPLLGQVLLSSVGWRSIFWAFLVYGAILSLWFYLRQPETLPENRASRFSLSGIVLSVRRILRHRRVMSYAAIAGLIFGIQLSYLANIEPVLTHYYGVTTLFPLFFAANAVGLCIAFFINSWLVRRIGMERLVLIALILLVSVGAVLLIAHLTSDGEPGAALFVAACLLMLFAIGLVFGNINAMAMDYLGDTAGLGASLIASVSSLIAFGVAFILNTGYDEGPGFLSFGMIACGLVSVVLLLYARQQEN